MKCPHCAIEIHPEFKVSQLNEGSSIGIEGRSITTWQVKHMECPSCNKAILQLEKKINSSIPLKCFIYPRAILRQSAPEVVPQDLKEDFDEAVAVLDGSPKASAALSRRCLQGLLSHQGYHQQDLAKAIDAILASNLLPKSLARNVDAIRNIGNFAAHPTKDKNSGCIVPVEPHEAEWNLDVLEGLFDYFYVQPDLDDKKIKALNEKLANAGKAPVKK
jgi:hypothetical protein